MSRLTIPAVTLAVTFWCSHGLEVSPLVFAAVWAGLTLSSALLWRFALREVIG